MLEFYKKAISLFLALFGLTLLLAFVCFERVFIKESLMPAHAGTLAWKLETITDVQKGGTSSISVTNSVSSLNYDYVLTTDVLYPHVTAVVAFAELQNAEHFVDLSKYSVVRFRVKCAPNNVMDFHLHSFDSQVTDRKNFSSYRIAGTLFSCNDEWSDVTIDLKHLNVATWWLETYEMPIADTQYWLDKVVAFSFGASRHGPINTPANVQIANLSLRGLDWHYAWPFVVAFVLCWLGFIFWFFKQYTQSLTAEVKSKIENDRPLIAYQQLSIEPHRDKEKSQILRFMATEYANPELSLEMAINELGINRTKINEILKDELGFTFNAYVNKLRLAEAARQLSATEEINVADIAYAVGYNNVTYFNKLFKNEYGCTPKKFRFIYQIEQAD